MRSDVPLSSSEATSIDPPCCFTILFDTNMPSPVPSLPLDEMKRLNRSYTGRDGLTDVLAFAQDEKDLLGDVVICPAKAMAESEVRSSSPMDELLLYAVHGTLHLLGYDDQGDEAEEMYAKEDDILKRLGVEVD